MGGGAEEGKAGSSRRGGSAATREVFVACVKRRANSPNFNGFNSTSREGSRHAAAATKRLSAAAAHRRSGGSLLRVAHNRLARSDDRMPDRPTALKGRARRCRARALGVPDLLVALLQHPGHTTASFFFCCRGSLLVTSFRPTIPLPAAGAPAACAAPSTLHSRRHRRSIIPPRTTTLPPPPPRSLAPARRLISVRCATANRLRRTRRHRAPGAPCAA